MKSKKDPRMSREVEERLVLYIVTLYSHEIVKFNAALTLEFVITTKGLEMFVEEVAKVLAMVHSPKWARKKREDVEKVDVAKIAFLVSIAIFDFEVCCGAIICDEEIRRD